MQQQRARDRRIESQKILKLRRVRWVSNWLLQSACAAATTAKLRQRHMMFTRLFYPFDLWKWVFSFSAHAKTTCSFIYRRFRIVSLLSRFSLESFKTKCSLNSQPESKEYRPVNLRWLHNEEIIDLHFKTFFRSSNEWYKFWRIYTMTHTLFSSDYCE